MIWHTQLFLWSRYSDIISLLTITVQGFQISIAYCLFHCIFLLLFDGFIIGVFYENGYQLLKKLFVERLLCQIIA